jgi:hypothetical protein
VIICAPVLRHGSYTKINLTKISSNLALSASIFTLTACSQAPQLAEAEAEAETESEHALAQVG